MKMEYICQTPPAKLVAKIKDARRVLISGHVRPDGDSLGCMIALSRTLRQIGILADAAVESKDSLGAPACLRGVDDLLLSDQAAERSYDLFISLDCGAKDRLPGALQPLVEKIPFVINIDHHCTNTRFGDMNWILGRISSTGEMVWRLIRKGKWPLDAITAEALWVAVVTDTGRFAYDMTGAGTLRCGADLVTHGVRTAVLNDKLYCSFSRVSVELKRRAFQSLQIEDDLAWVTLTGKDFQETGGAKSDAEDVIEFPRSIVGNQVALFFYGPEDNMPGETRVSIRTRAPLDASALAARFDGGGHARAAGCTIHASLGKAKKLFFEAYRSWREEHSSSTITSK